MLSKVVAQWGEKTDKTLINGTVRALLTQPCHGVLSESRRFSENSGNSGLEAFVLHRLSSCGFYFSYKVTRSQSQVEYRVTPFPQ